VLLGDLRDEVRDVDADRAAAHARLVGALQAAFGFTQRVFEAVAAGDLLEVLRPDLRILLRHRRPLLRNGADRPLLRGRHGPS